MLSVVAILRERNCIAKEIGTVSRTEVLDGLLAMVDRYAHVQLGVDERLHIREQLGRGLAPEVHRYLRQPFYRDHLLHVIDVFLLGNLMLDSRMCWLDDRPKTLADNITYLVSEDVAVDVRRLLPKDWRRDWAVASLLHDIGYQLGSSHGVTEDERAGDFFAIDRPSKYSWLDLRSARSSISLTKKLHDMIGHFGADDSTVWWLPPAKTYDMDDHGILSALRVAQLLTTVLDSAGKPVTRMRSGGSLSISNASCSHGELSARSRDRFSARALGTPTSLQTSQELRVESRDSRLPPTLTPRRHYYATASTQHRLSV
jgi:hypothetical protein